MKSPLSDFWDWMTEREGWKAFSGGVYLFICVFDFVVVPMWFGLARPQLPIDKLTQFDTAVQIQLIQAHTAQHEPFTLKGAGMFHLAFGALLTGSAIAGRRGIKNDNPDGTGSR
jgi:hypothetical protein